MFSIAEEHTKRPAPKNQRRSLSRFCLCEAMTGVFCLLNLSLYERAGPIFVIAYVSHLRMPVTMTVYFVRSQYQHTTIVTNIASSPTSPTHPFLYNPLSIY
jgi:hypothetical protein